MARILARSVRELSRPSVRVLTLGRFEVERNGAPLRFSRKTPRKPLDLLKVLIALGGQSVPTEQLTDALWPESDGDAAYDSLRTTASRLRKLIGAKTLLRQDGRWSLNFDVCWTDAWTLTALLRETQEAGGRAAPSFDRLEQALALYRGPFLDGEFDLPPVLSARQRLHGLLLRHLAELGGRYERAGEHARAIDVYRKALDVDDLAEDIYQRLMRCYQAGGRTAEAIALYQRCCEALRAHVGSEPSPETQALYRAVLGRQTTVPMPAVDVAEHAPHVTSQPAERSIAVLAFEVAGDSGRSWFADAIGQSIISLLGKIPFLSTAAKNSSFAYRGRDVDVRRIGRALGVRYVLEGSVLFWGNRARLSAQLIDAGVGHQVWGDVYDRDMDDVLRAQDEIALAVVTAVQMKLCTGMLVRGADATAWEARTLAAEYSGRHRKADNRRAREMHQLALQCEPEDRRALVFIGNTHFLDYWFNWSADPARSLGLAEGLVRQGLPADTGIGVGHGILGYIHALREEYEAAVTMADAANDTAPANPVAHALRGNVLMYTDAIEAGLDALDEAFRLHPMPPHWFYKDAATGNVLLRRYEEAIPLLTAVTRSDAPQHRAAALLTERLLLVACLQATRQVEEARHEAQGVLACYRSVAAGPWCRWYLRPFKDKQPATEIARLLVAAGLPA
jgi:TolB-like protein